VLRSRLHNEADFLDVLYGLLDKHLLTQDGGGRGGPERRLRMLDTVPEYAAERLAESGEEEAIRERHALFFRDLAEASFPQMYSPARTAWIESLKADHGNLLAALAWCLDGQGSRETGMRLAGALGRYWYFIGNLNEGRYWLSRSLAAAPRAPRASRARALYSAGKLAWVQGDYVAAVRLVEDSLALYSAGEDELGRAEALTLLGYSLMGLGDVGRALKAYEESLGEERRLGAEWQVAFSLAMSSEPIRLSGEADRARAYLDEALALFRRLGDRWGEGVALANRAGFHSQLGAMEQADAWAEQAEAAFAEFPDERYAFSRIRLIRGYFSLQAGDRAKAAQQFMDALRLGGELGQTAYILIALAGTGALAALLGRVREAVLLFGRATPVLESGSPYVDDGAVAARRAFAEVSRAIKERLGARSFDEWLSEGRDLSLERATELAIGIIEQAKAAPPAS